MRMVCVLALWLVGLLVGCTNDPGNSRVDAGNRRLDCDTLSDPPEMCGSACGSDADCFGGTFCSNSVCIAMCTVEEGCNSNEVCTAQGRCLLVNPPNDGGVDPDGDSCEPTFVTPTRIVPNVLFVVDRSGSMPAQFDGGRDRWEAAYDAIMGDQSSAGVIAPLQSLVRFALTDYTAHGGIDTYIDSNGNNRWDSGETVTGWDVDDQCPRLKNYNFAFDNYNAIDATYSRTFPDGNDTPKDTRPYGDDTPTGEALFALNAQLRANPPPGDADDPTIYVLATDGDPDRCDAPDGPGQNDQESRDRVVNAATEAFGQGIRTFVLAVGDELSEDHQQEVANVGVGKPRDAAQPAPVWRATSTQALVDAFLEIVTAEITCDVRLNADVVDASKLDEAVVTMDGTPLQFGVDWRIKSGTTDIVELLGDACDDWTSGQASSLSAEFACGTVIVP